MLKIFGGMILGSITTMMLLGGPSAANQVLANAQTLYVNSFSRPDAPTTLLLLIVLSVFMVVLNMWPSKADIKTEKVIKKLRRHCK